MLDRTRGVIERGCSGSDYPPASGAHRLLCTTQIRRGAISTAGTGGPSAYLGKTDVQRGASLLRLGPELRLLFLFLNSSLVRRSVMYKLSLDDLCGVGSCRLYMAESMSPPSVSHPPGEDSIFYGPGTLTLKHPGRNASEASRSRLWGQGWRMSAACRLGRPANRAKLVARPARTSDGGRRRVQQKPHGDGSGKHQ
jgi:hypothetical protein